MSSTDDNQEDFAALLDEYEQRTTQSQRMTLPKAGDTVKGNIVSIGNDTIFVSLGAKAEAVLDRDQATDSDGQLQVAVGDTIEARVVEVRGGQVVLRTSLGRGPAAREELQQAHQHQIPVEGQVTGVIKGGVEVQVAGVRAFCPISQLDNRFVDDPNAFVGDKLQFRIIRYEAGRGPHVNIVLSRRVLLEEVARARAVETRAKLKVGAVLSGQVTSIKGYGAFIDLGGIEGMLHISELGFTRVEHPSEVVSVGQELEVQVIKIEKTDNPKRPEKIGLSLKALADDPWQTTAETIREGSRVQGKVVRTESFGAFVQIAPGVEGLVHISEMGAKRHLHHARDMVNIGDEVTAIVLSVDLGRRRIGLSIAEIGRREESQEVAQYQESQESGRGRGKSNQFGTLGDLLKFKKR